MAHKEDCQCIICQRTRTKRERETAPPPETTEQHMNRLGCFTPGEVEALLKVEVSHEHIDQLGRDKGVGLDPPAGIDAEAEAIIKESSTASDLPSLATGDGEPATTDPLNEANAGDKPPLP